MVLKRLPLCPACSPCAGAKTSRAQVEADPWLSIACGADSASGQRLMRERTGDICHRTPQSHLQRSLNQRGRRVPYSRE